MNYCPILKIDVLISIIYFDIYCKKPSDNIRAYVRQLNST